jgi:hypothetical protein
VGAVEAAREALRARHAELRAAHLEDPVVALQHVDAALGQRGRDLVAAVRVPVVVAQHREHGDAVEHLHGARDHGGLLRHPVGGEVAREQDDVDAVAEAAEGRGPALLVGRPAEVDVAGRRDADGALVLAVAGRSTGLGSDGHAAPRTRVPRIHVVR